ncbi:hypothetical protein SO802_033174 [Lithocarpus litseifolius]|uniref:RNase H type-1 domain-containing protein n=1 Tax=Lithocarpus litseifolius TaxID=425828 RepID=A0AAW2BCE7_9ROSI
MQQNQLYTCKENALRPEAFGIPFPLLFTPTCSIAQILRIGSESIVFRSKFPSRVLAGVLSSRLECGVYGFGVIRWSSETTPPKSLLRQKLLLKRLSLLSLVVSLVVLVRAGGGELIRDSSGAWVSGCARAIGHTTSVVAKLWALRDGINLCIELNLTNVLIKFDMKLVVDLLLKEEGTTNGNDVIIIDCKEGMQRIPRVRVRHCYREAIKCADTLARRGVVSPQDFVIY